MHILQETAVGYALFKSMPLEMEGLRRFKNAKDAVESLEGTINGIIPEGIIELIAEKEVKTLGISSSSNSKIADQINSKLKGSNVIRIVSGEEVDKITKEIHRRLPELMNISEKELARSSLLLAHALCRERLKMTPLKNDLVIVQTIKIIDRLDKDINNKCMRIREWYGMHFPELGEMIENNQKYMEIVKMHAKGAAADNQVLSDEILKCLEKTIGGEITDEDRELIAESAATVIDMYQTRDRLHEHLYNRMQNVAPNVLELLGALLGARIIAHAGSLSELSRKAASTIQMMGAEKALFKALKEKQVTNTPKYGVIYNSTYVGQVPADIKGQVARTLAGKIAIASRCDASGEEEKGDYGVKAREEIEKRIAALTQKKNSTGEKTVAQTPKFVMKRPSAPQQNFSHKRQKN